jgi:hypothetical protein
MLVVISTRMKPYIAAALLSSTVVKKFLSVVRCHSLYVIGHRVDACGHRIRNWRALKAGWRFASNLPKRAWVQPWAVTENG